VTTSAEYDRHLQSKTWKRKAKAARRRAGWRCERCGESRPLDVHHKTYARFKKELAKDLEALCRPCHEAHHAKKEGDNMSLVIPEPVRIVPTNGEEKALRQRKGPAWCPGHSIDLPPAFILKVKEAYFDHGGRECARHVPPQENGACLGPETFGRIARGNAVRAGLRTVEGISYSLNKLASLEVPDPQDQPEPEATPLPEQLPLAKPTLTPVILARVVISNTLDLFSEATQQEILSEINARYR